MVERQQGFENFMHRISERTLVMSMCSKSARLFEPLGLLLNLKNAFGEAQHSLIYTVLRYHHVPDHFTSIIRSLYDGFPTNVTTKEYATPFINVEKDVLQDDCLSLLLFNLCINSFIQSIKTKEFEQFISYRCSKLLSPKHWLQSADDAIAVSATEFENQTLVNAL